MNSNFDEKDANFILILNLILSKVDEFTIYFDKFLVTSIQFGNLQDLCGTCLKYKINF